MLRIYHSNQLDLLKTLMASLIERQPLSDPFAKEVVLVQSHGMAHWLQMQLADYFDIAANIDFPLPASFIWQIFSQVLMDIPQETAFSKPAMTWKLMYLLPNMLSDKDFVSLSNYLTDDSDKRKAYQLAGRLADIFDHYLVYRPDWLQQWRQGELVTGLDENQLWQAKLWCALEDYTHQREQSPWHRANLYQRAIDRLNRDTDPIDGLPIRIFICGISSLPPMYIQVLQALGRHIDVHLLFTNPCRYYWGDIQDYTFLNRLQMRRRTTLQKSVTYHLFRQPDNAENLFNAQGEQQLTNPLLASWGKQGRDNLYLLSQLDNIQEVDAFVDIEPDNLLHRIQGDLLELEDFSVIGDTAETVLSSEKKRLLATDDRSVEINACHSVQREVEVLHDRLLALLDTDPSLTCRDIIVMVADIDRYVPYIQAVFANAPADRYLPFTISDRRASNAHPVIQAFLSLLSLPKSRFSAEDILGLLDVPALAARFAIDEAGLHTLRQWVEGAGIRWGLDDIMQSELDLPSTHQNTWQFGITRMLLGYAMNSDSGDWQGILPYDQSSGLIASLAGQLAGLLHKLSSWRIHLQGEYCLQDWQPLCRQLIDDFFVVNTETEAILTLIEQQWQTVLQYAISAGYDQPVPMTILHDELAQYLDSQRMSQRFLAGPINFCTLMPMRSIPFKVVCLLGMNDGVYPRVLQSPAFDLMALQPQRGDRSRRDDDRYLFLEALLSAQQHFYISYIGRSLQDNSKRYPSILVQELVDYITQSHVLPGDEKEDIDTSAQRVGAHLIKQFPRVPFSPENFLVGGAVSYAKEWLPAALRRQSSVTEVTAELTMPPLTSLLIDELRRFYRHPVRSFFQQRLHVYFGYHDVALADQEPFNLNSLQRYQINDDLLNRLINGEDAGLLFRRLRGAGQLPHGAFGELLWSEQLTEMTSLAQVILAEKQPLQSQAFSIELNGITLSGQLHQVQQDGVLRWRAAKLTVIDAMMLWLDHLVYTLAGGEGESRMYGRNNSRFHFAALTTEQAKHLLTDLLDGYQTGMCQPLWLLPRSAWSWLDSCYLKDSRQIDWRDQAQSKARQQLLHTLQGDLHVNGEANDPYLRRLFTQPNQPQLQLIIEAAERYLLPLCQFMSDRSSKDHPAKPAS